MTDDLTLLREYAARNSESAFAELVSRHINLVYSVARRQVGDAHLAEEVAQAVFIILARKANQLSGRTVLSGWLCRTAHYASADVLKQQRRRQQREQEVFMQSQIDSPSGAADESWTQIAPLLDDAMATLGAKDHDALVLRFFEGRNFAEVGACLGASEDAAKVRVSRALEKLRRIFGKRGIALTAAAIAGAVSVNSVQAAPAGLAGTISAMAAAKGAAAGTSTLTLIKGALKIMAWTKAKTAIAISAGVFLAAGTATVTLTAVEAHRSWRMEGFDSQLLDRQPPQVKVLPSKLHGGSHGYASDTKMMGTGVSAQTLVSVAYGFPTAARTVADAPLPATRFDYIASLPAGNEEALRSEVKKTLGVVGKIETRSADVWLLRVKSPGVAGLKESTVRPEDSSESWGYNYYAGRAKSLGHLTCALELAAQAPVIDATGLTKSFDVQLKWDQKDYQTPNVEAINRALGDQLGLELVPTNMPLQMLVVENAK